MLPPPPVALSHAIDKAQLAYRTAAWNLSNEMVVSVLALHPLHLLLEGNQPLQR